MDVTLPSKTWNVFNFIGIWQEYGIIEKFRVDAAGINIFIYTKPEIKTMADKVLNAVEAIVTRRSIRKYKDIPVTWDQIGTLIECAKTAPSAGNLQNWKFIIVRNEETRKQISEACAQQYWMAKANVHIVVCVLPFKAQQFFGIRGERLYTIQNAAAAAENIIIAATAMGLGSCWVSYFDDNTLRRILSIPDYASPQAVITIGYADEQPPKPVHYTIEHVSGMEFYGNRIKDLDMTLGYYGNWLQRNIKEKASALKKKIDKLSGK